MERYIERQIELNDYEEQIINSKLSQKYIQATLSPLHRAAIKNEFKPFIYEVGGQQVYISIAALHKILRNIVASYELLFYQDLKEQRSTNIPIDRREIFDHISVVLSLHPWLRNRLWDLECYTLYKIMRKGRSFFLNEQKFSKKAMATLDGLFAKYHCSHLFV